MSTDREWVRVASAEELPEGRVKSVSAGSINLALVHFQGQWTAMENACPHQGGPLGEGSIEEGVEGKCWLRCPWHGWDFDPLTGKPPGGHEDSGQEMYPVELREDGGIYVAVPLSEARTRTMTDAVAETLVNFGVKTVFGMVGHSNLGLSEAIRLQAEKGALQYFGIRHEGGAAFAASAYGKLTGRPAGVLTIAGPGATNALTGMWDAKVDRAPILALTGQVQTQVFGPGAFQDIDLASAYGAVSKFSRSLLPNSNPSEIAALAAKTAIIERDVAHIIFPDDVQTLPSEQAAHWPEGRISGSVVRPEEQELAKAAEMIGKAKRPILIAGHGAFGAAEEVISLAEKLGAPLLTTFKAKGLVADSHPNAAGVLGRSGTPIASWFMNECDLIVALGASFSNHTGIEPSKPIIQVDFERMQLGRFHSVAHPVWSEIGVFCTELQAILPEGAEHESQISELAERWRMWREEKASRLAQEGSNGLASVRVFDALSEVIPEKTLIAVDVGNNTYSFGRYFEPKPGQRFVMSGYLGSIGFAMPAALGLYAATKSDARFEGRKVVSVSGDGGFGQYPMEFTTAVKYGMDITHILLNNSELGKISKEQRAGHWPVWETSLVNPSFAGFARSSGGLGFNVRTPEELMPALKEALAHPGPALVEINMDAELI